MHSVTKHLTRPVIAFVLLAQRDRLPGNRSDGFALSAPGSGLRLESAGSSLRTAESCSSSYGLHVRLRLLPTPPRGDAVTFGYRERASPGRGLAPLRSRLLAGARIPAFAGMTQVALFVIPAKASCRRQDRSSRSQAAPGEERNISSLTGIYGKTRRVPGPSRSCRTWLEASAHGDWQVRPSTIGPTTLPAAAGWARHHY